MMPAAGPASRRPSPSRTSRISRITSRRWTREAVDAKAELHRRFADPVPGRCRARSRRRLRREPRGAARNARHRSDRHHAPARLRRPRRPGSRKRPGGHRRRDRAATPAQSAGIHEPAAPRRKRQRKPKQPLSARRHLSRVQRFASARHASRDLGVPGRRAHQRAVRRHGELGSDPGLRDLDDQPHSRFEPLVRSEHARRRAVDPDQERRAVSGNGVVAYDDGDANASSVNRTRTSQRGYGFSTQAALTSGNLPGGRNLVIVGGGYDRSASDFRQSYQLGGFNADRSAAPTGAETEIVNLDGGSATASLFATDTHSPSPRWHFTGSARYNVTRVRTVDGLSPPLPPPATGLGDEPRFFKF